MNVSNSHLPLGSMNPIPTAPAYFTELTVTKALLYAFAAIYVISVAVVSIIQPWLSLPCDNPGKTLEFANPAYDGTRCPHIRHAILLWMSPEECSFARRLLASVLLGGIIGWERRQADRPAGIRTMSLVSLGSCFFTINSTFAFINGPMAWDASRVSAAIPSGVGFLGAGLIFKKEERSEDGDTSHVVHGLTTAASLWLSAAVGIACGGDLYFPASFGVALVLLLLRFGPRGSDENDEEEEEEGIPQDFSVDKKTGYESISKIDTLEMASPIRTKSEREHRESRMSMRKRAALGSIV
jgi:putative Mg2+ transporter-C (MgtC) family protein